MFFKFVDPVFYSDLIPNMILVYFGPICKKTALWNSILATQIVIFEFLLVILEMSFYAF